MRKSLQLLSMDMRGSTVLGVLLTEPLPFLCSLPLGSEETREVRERMGIMVHYNVKIRCVVSFGS